MKFYLRFKIVDLRLALSLLKTRILFVDDVQPAFTTDDLTIDAALFDGCSDFHFDQFLLLQLFVSENDAPSRQVVRTHFHTYFVPWQNPYVVHSHFT